ncbi:unnamed protein product [Heterobilharzia americana]|nr:unnamed protein product [Heterobilharzia americana]
MIQQEKEFQEEEERKNISSDMNNNPTKNQQSNQDYQDPNSNLTSKSSLQLFRSFLLPFSTKQLAKTTVFGILLFNGEVMTYFGLLLYARAVRGNVYLVSFINACTTIPALFMSTILYRVVRLRKPPLLFVFAVAFIILLSCGLYTYICNPENDLTLAIGSNLALVFLGAGLFMLYIYIPELYPSVMRSQGFGINAGLGRIGSILCTFVNQMDFYVGHGSPLLIYSVVTLLQLFILCIIPDTSGENLPDVLAKKQSDTEDANDLTSSVFSVSEFTRV